MTDNPPGDAGYLRHLIDNAITGRREGPPWPAVIRRVLHMTAIELEHAGAAVHPDTLTNPDARPFLDALLELGIPVLALPIIPPGAYFLGPIERPA